MIQIILFVHSPLYIINVKKVLIPTDFSQASHRVIARGLSFFKSFSESYKLFLLNTYMVPLASSAQVIVLNDELKNKSIAGLVQDLQMLKDQSDATEVTAEIISQIGALENVIPRIVKEREIDCVVMGMDDRLRQEGISAVLNRVQCPILVIP